MRQVFLVVLGMVIGAVAAANIGAALRARHAYPRGLMQVMQHELGAMRQSARDGRCDATAQLHWTRLAGLAPSIESAVYGESTINPADPPFAEFARRLRAALAEVPDCKQFAPAVARVAQACDDCHRQYR